ncbi:hypothetical protein PG984_006525 [Apiospora sp. TS-2023a]
MTCIGLRQFCYACGKRSEVPPVTMDDLIDLTSRSPRSTTNEAPVETTVETAVEIPGEAPDPIAPAWFFTEKVDHAAKDIWAPRPCGRPPIDRLAQLGGNE